MMRSPCFDRSLSHLWLTGMALVACRPEESIGGAGPDLVPIEPTTLVFRVRDERGPLVRAELEVSIQQRLRSSPGANSFSSQPLLTDDGGFLRCQLGAIETTAPYEFLVTVATRDSYSQRTGLVTHGEMRIDDLVLAPMPVLASGRVIDPAGNPVAGALLSAPDDGGFTGKILLDPEIPSESVQIQLYGAEPWPLEDLYHDLWELETLPDAEGAFLLLHRRPGKHRARVLVDGLELFEIQDVIVPAGSIGTDARCDPLDLRGLIHVRRITLVAPSGMRELKGQFLVCRQGEGTGIWKAFEGSELLVLSPFEAQDIWLQGPGLRSFRLAGVREDRTVALEPGWPIRLVLMDGISLPEPPVSWSVVLYSKSSGPGYPPIQFEPGRREARSIAGETGELEVAWIRSESDKLEEGPTRGGRFGWPRQTVEVRDVPGEQVLRLGWVPVRP
jgi:hypothetical protein